MDILSFKKKVVQTDPDYVGFDAEYILAEIIINDRPFLDMVWECHSDNNYLSHGEYDYNIASQLYIQLTDTHGAQHGDWPGLKNAVLLTCGCCYYEEDYPLLVSFEETETEVIWSSFDNERIKFDYKSALPVLKFDKEQYKTALEQLRTIAGE